MKTPVYLILSLFAFAPFYPAKDEPKRGSGPQLGHMVFFDLREDSKEAREKLAAGCLKYLGDHEGTVYFSVGTLVEDLRREVNDLDFDVALHLVFRDKAAHDKYQTHPRHLKFIEENKALWKKVRVFDSYLSAPPAN